MSPPGAQARRAARLEVPVAQRLAAVLAVVAVVAAIGATVPARAQTPAPAFTPAMSAADASVRSMIETLQAPPRSRNLVVRPRDGADNGSPGAHRADGANGPDGADGADAEPDGLALQLVFAGATARLRPESGPVLGDLVAALQSPDLRGRRFLIEGHAEAGRDAGGAARAAAAPVLAAATPAARRLAQERADEVRAYLVALGVAPQRLVALGSAAAPVADARPNAAARDGRVRVRALD